MESDEKGTKKGQMECSANGVAAVEGKLLRPPTSPGKLPSNAARNDGKRYSQSVAFPE